MPDLIQHFNDPLKPVWVLISNPYSNDSSDGYLFSGGYGYNFKKLWQLGGLSLDDIHIRSLRPCIGASYTTDNILSNLLIQIEQYHPTFIVPLTDEILNYLVPYTTQQKEKNSSIRKWAGSILKSEYISYPHYIIPTQEPEWVTRNWAYNEIQAFIDFGHVREEYEYWRQNGVLNPLPKQQLITSPNYPDLLALLHGCLVGRNSISSVQNNNSQNPTKYISLDIETIRPKKNTRAWINNNPGYPYTIAIATSPKEAFSFGLWDYPADQAVKIWRLLGEILANIPQIGQNYFVFDAHYLERLGFRMCLDKCQDTLIRHHILWPSLEHKLQFQTKQYTRQPFYKDESAGFSWTKYKDKIMRYNCLDACITYEIYEEQEKEFQSRSHLL